MPKSRLHELSELGQSVWIDNLSRELLETGDPFLAAVVTVYLVVALLFPERF